MKDVRVIKINIRDSTAQQTVLREEAARLWVRLVNLHKYCRKRHWNWPTQGELEKHFKGRFALHSQTIQALECASKTLPALSFSTNKSLVNAIYGNAKSYYDICGSYSNSIDTSKLIKLLNKLKIDHSISDDEGEVILMNASYLDSMKCSRIKQHNYDF